MKLTLETYLKAFETSCTSHEHIKGGTIWDFLKESKITYYGGKCPVYYIEHFHPQTKQRCVIGGNYASNGKPKLEPYEEIDFD